MSDHITSITDDTFEQEVLKSDVPVLVDYWAEWCGPCKAIGPVLEDVAPGYEGKVRIVKMNIDENPNTPPQVRYPEHPHPHALRERRRQGTKLGALSKNQLTDFLDGHA